MLLASFHRFFCYALPTCPSAWRIVRRTVPKCRMHPFWYGIQMVENWKNIHFVHFTIHSRTYWKNQRKRFLNSPWPLLQGAEVFHPELNKFYVNDPSPFITEIHQKHFPTHFGQDAKVPSRPSHEFCLEGGIWGLESAHRLDAVQRVCLEQVV